MINKMEEEKIESLFQNLQSELTKNNFANASQNAEVSLDPAVEQVNMREELINLAENGKIKYTPNYIKKASFVTLEKIKETHEKKQLEETNDYIANSIISSVDKLLKYFDLIKNTDELEKDLKNNDLFKRDVKQIVGRITPSIPLVGLLCGGATVGKHIITNTYEKVKPTCPNPPTEKTKQEETEI